MSSEEFSFPRRSEGGLAAADVFYRGYNEFYFYVEDEDQENLYFEILRKLFPDVELEKIFPLGGKSNVLAHSMEESNQIIEKRVYLLDKDFDDLLGVKQDIKGVFYLGDFCIENYFLEEEALIEIVHESHPKKQLEEIRSNLSLSEVIPSIGSNLRPLFALFFLAQKSNLGIENSSQKPEVFCQKRCLWEVCPELLAKYSSRVSALLVEVGDEQPSVPLQSDPRLVDFEAALDGEIVSGKFWLAMLFHYLKSKYNLGSITFDSFVFRTAKKCSFERLASLVEEVDATYRS